MSRRLLRPMICLLLLFSGISVRGEQLDDKQAQIADQVSSRLRFLRQRIHSDLKDLEAESRDATKPKLFVSIGKVEGYLDSIETSMLDAAQIPELDPLRVYIKTQFKVFHELLDKVDNDWAADKKATAVDAMFKLVQLFVDVIYDAAKENELTSDFCFLVTSANPGEPPPNLWLLNKEGIRGKVSSRRLFTLYRGLYSYRVESYLNIPFNCLGEETDGGQDCFLNTWAKPQTTLICDVATNSCSQSEGKDLLKQCNSSPDQDPSSGAPVNDKPVKQIEVSRGDRIAISLILSLPATLERFNKLRTQLQASEPGEEYSASGVAGVLNPTQTSLHAALDVPELSALSDQATALFTEARRSLSLKNGQAVAARRPVVLLASFEPDRSKSVEAKISKEKANSWFSKIADFITTLLERARTQGIVVRLCVVSRPDGAHFRIHPPSRPERIFETSTVGELQEVYLGLYSYEMSLDGFKPLRCDSSLSEGKASCAPLDLWDDLRPVLDCDLTRGACRRRERSAPRCQDEK